jgi:hypothetical protein
MTCPYNFYYYNIQYNESTNKFWKEVNNVASPGGRFMLDLAKLEPNRWINRSQGEWSYPWPVSILEKYAMPEYNPNFKKNFSEITDARALEVKNEITKNNTKFLIGFSGGLDSTLILTSLLKNCNKKELKNITVLANTVSFAENPYFYKKYIEGKFTILDSDSFLLENHFNDIDKIIQTWNAECLVGSRNWLDLTDNFYSYIKDLKPETRRYLLSVRKKSITADVHYSAFKDLIINQYAAHGDKRVGELYYYKMVKNIESSGVPVYSLYDFHWWNLFNIKFINLSLKSFVFDSHNLTYDRYEKKNFDWFLTKDYQQWSMTNNNNGEKIQSLTSTTMKMCFKKYIHEFDKNDWYFYFKTKIASYEVLKNRDKITWKDRPDPRTKFGINKNFNNLNFENLLLDDKNLQNYILNSMSSYNIDW